MSANVSVACNYFDLTSNDLEKLLFATIAFDVGTGMEEITVLALHD